MDRTVLYRERDIMLYSHSKTGKMPSSDAASFYSELTHSERPPRRMNFGI